MVGIVELAATSRFQIVDPCEAMLLNEVVIQPKTVDFEIAGMPTSRLGQVFQVGAEEFRDMQAARIVIATVEQNDALA